MINTQSISLFSKLKNTLQKEMPETLILVVGCYNSGTTLLSSALGQHHEISGLKTEGVSLTKEFKTPEEFGWNRLWYKCQDQLEIQKLTQVPDINQVRKDWKQYFDNNKSFALEKSIIHSLNIDWFEHHFNHPYFIWIIRNGYAVAEGIRRRTLHKQRKSHLPGQPYPIEWCAQQWVTSNQIITQKLKHTKNSYQLFYEDLVEEYDENIQQLLRWLPVQSKTITKLKSFTFHQKTLPIQNMNPSSIKRLSIEDIQKVNSIAKNELKKWGYTILTGTE